MDTFVLYPYTSMNRFTVIALSLFCAISAKSQTELNASEIKHELKKLNTLCSVLYIAAHPDDENTRIIAYMSNEKMARTAYLSLTRGDGGQNLVGSEKGASIGVLRTQELLQARKIDRGEQFFTRAVDFGYSKTADESFTKWDRDNVLADVVWAIRKFRPDVIITRFPPTSRAGHGHHTASAILAEEAFDLAGDEKAFPEQLQYVSVWYPKRLFFNHSTWWEPDLAIKAQENDSFATVDVGTFNPLLGKSYAEIAAMSRSMHKSQGFGSQLARGSRIEYLQWIKGESYKKDMFEGINCTWSRIESGKEIGKMLNDITKSYDLENPSAIVPQLLEVKSLIRELPDAHWRELKLRDIDKLILACGGIWVEAISEEQDVASNKNMAYVSELVNRSNLDVKLKMIRINGQDSACSVALPNNEMIQVKSVSKAPDYRLTNPYWLNAIYEGMFKVDEATLIGLPQNQPVVNITYELEIEGHAMTVERPIVYKYTDRVKGEVYAPFVVLPGITANFNEEVYVFSSDQPKEITVTLEAHDQDLKGTVSLNLPESWRVEPASISYDFKSKNDVLLAKFNVFPSRVENVAEIGVTISGIDGSVKSLERIEYDHIPVQTLLPDATSKLVRLDVKTKGEHVGYVEGAGDDVPQALEQLGYTVHILDELALKTEDLSKYDAIICGIRAYNTNAYLSKLHNKLMTYVESGGNFIVQYNTNRGINPEQIGPYPFKLSRDRVTVEQAEPTFLAPEHKVMTQPNVLSKSDFDNWVQERGLYFPNSWDERYVPILGWNDPGETSKTGSLIIAEYGKGTFVYTGISFFRQLPAGVPGAFKLIANLVSLNQ